MSEALMALMLEETLSSYQIGLFVAMAYSILQAFRLNICSCAFKLSGDSFSLIAHGRRNGQLFLCGWLYSIGHEI